MDDADSAETMTPGLAVTKGLINQLIVWVFQSFWLCVLQDNTVGLDVWCEMLLSLLLSNALTHQSSPHPPTNFPFDIGRT